MSNVEQFLYLLDEAFEGNDEHSYDELHDRTTLTKRRSVADAGRETVPNGPMGVKNDARPDPQIIPSLSRG